MWSRNWCRDGNDGEAVQGPGDTAAVTTSRLAIPSQP